MDRLSYRAYGNIVMITLLIMIVLFNCIPYPNLDLITTLIYIIEIPIYLIVRGKLNEPIHAIGLNICFTLTTIFYFLIFLIIKLSLHLIDKEYVFILASVLTITACYFTSTYTNKVEEKGKLFFGFKAKDEPSKYQKLIDFIKFNPLDDRLLKYEKYLKENDNLKYMVYKYKFIDKMSFSKISDELGITTNKITEVLDKIYETLKYALQL